LIQFGLSQFGDKTADRKDELTDAIYRFFESRIDGILADQGFAKDSVAAITAVSVDQIPDAWRRVEALDRIRAEADFGPLAVAFKRTVNILKKSDQDVGRQTDLPLDEGLFENPCEAALLQAYKAVKEKVAANVENGDYEAALRQIATLKAPVDDFFEGVMVMADDDAVRTNRLALLDRLAGLFTNIADFSKITT
jgi:glycyl-tRNA synthetase beta chain